jgi:lipoprotein signal peptidase
LAFIFFGNIGNWYDRLFSEVSPMIVFARYLMLAVFLGVVWLIYEAAKSKKN